MVKDIAMVLLGKAVLSAFSEKHADAKSWIERWVADMEGNEYKTPQEVKDKYSSVSFLKDNCLIFNVRGNKYRLETIFAYATKIVIAKWAGTHAEYDERNKKR